VNTLTGQKADLQKQLVDAKAACDASTAGLQKQIDDLTAQVDDLKTKLAAASTTLLKAATK
jgi:chaperonin cofactor prefoldin